MSPAPERSARGDDEPPGGGPAGGPQRWEDEPAPSPAPSGEHPPPAERETEAMHPAGLQCRLCQKSIVDLEMEVYFLQTGLCFWCAYVDSQG